MKTLLPQQQKNGLKISEVNAFVEWCINDMDLRVTGLMCIPPIDGEPSYYFNLLSNLKEKLQLDHALRVIRLARID